MSKPSEHIPNEVILREAADWFARISDESATEQDSAALKNWLTQHPDHSLAWEYVLTVTDRFQQATHEAGKKGARKILNASRIDNSRRKALIIGSLTCVSAILGWRYTPLGSYGYSQTNYFLADVHTKLGQTYAMSLDDGGRIILNTSTAIDVNYSDARNIKLRQGEIFIETAKDSGNRPFIVTSSHGELTALGTRFTVYKQRKSTLVAVYDGAVRIDTKEGLSKVVNAGRQVVFNKSVIQSASAAQNARKDWARGVLRADNITLREFINEFSRYSTRHITVDDQVADIKVVGSYPLNRPNDILKMLAGSLPISIEQPYPWWTEIKPSE